MTDKNPFEKYVGSKPLKITRELLEQSKPYVLQPAESKKLRVPLDTERVYDLWGMAGREVSGVQIQEVDGAFEIRIDLKEKRMPAAPVMIGWDPGSHHGPARSYQQIWQNSWSPSDPLMFVSVKMGDQYYAGQTWGSMWMQRCELVDTESMEALPEQPDGADLYLSTDLVHDAGSMQSVPFWSLRWLTPPEPEDPQQEQDHE